jgi:adenylate kinase family enzyme
MADVEVHSIIHIVVSDEVLFQRILGRNESRTNNNPESLGKRLTTYHEQTLRILQNFETYSKLKAVEGDTSVEEVYRRVLEVVN